MGKYRFDVGEQVQHENGIGVVVEILPHPSFPKWLIPPTYKVRLPNRRLKLFEQAELRKCKK